MHSNSSPVSILLPRLTLLILFLLAGAVLLPTTSLAQGSTDDPEVLPESYQLLGGLVAHSAPSFGDLTGDGKQEIVIGTSMLNGITWQQDRPASLTALRSDGSILWTKEYDAPIGSTAAIGDINGGGLPEVVVGLGGDAGNINRPGGVVALLADGTQLWRYDPGDWYPLDGLPDAVFSSPALCETDGDPQAEIAFGSWGQRIHLVDNNGVSLWNNINWPGKGYFNADAVWSSPTCVDLNGDGIDEIIIGADISGGDFLPDGTPAEDGGFLYIFDASGQPLVRRYLPETIYSSPAVADLNCDGLYEIVVGTGDYWYYAHGQSEQPYVYAFSTQNVFSSMAYADPNKLPHLPGWPRPTQYPGIASPALGDLDMDGDLEIVVVRSKHSGGSAPFACNNGNGDCYSAIYAWHHNGQPVSGFPMWPTDYLGKNASTSLSPVIANVDGDPVPEIVLSMLWDVLAIGNTGQLEKRFQTTWSVGSTPSVADTNNDGQFEVWAGGGNLANPAHGYLWRFSLDDAQINHQPWPKFRQSSDNRGIYPVSGSLIATPSIPVHDPANGTLAAGAISLYNPGPVPLGWSVATLPNRVSTSAPTGLIGVEQGASVPLTISTQGLGQGYHPLGNARVNTTYPTCSAMQFPGSNLPLGITIGEVNRVHLPIIGK